MKYEVEILEMSDDKGRVTREFFGSVEEAREYADQKCKWPTMVRRCSIYKENILVQDVM